MLQRLRRVVKKESSSLMTVRKRRIFGMKKKLTMQHKSNPDRGTAHSWYAWGNRFCCFVLLKLDSLCIVSRFGVSLSSDSSPKSAVRNGGGGCGSASGEEDVEEEASPQQSTAAQTQSECYIIPHKSESFSWVHSMNILCICVVHRLRLGS